MSIPHVIVSIFHYVLLINKLHFNSKLYSYELNNYKRLMIVYQSNKLCKFHWCKNNCGFLANLQKGTRTLKLVLGPRKGPVKARIMLGYFCNELLHAFALVRISKKIKFTVSETKGVLDGKWFNFVRGN